MLFWLVFGFYWHWPVAAGNYVVVGNHLLLFVLFALLGWKVFGSPVRD